MGMRTHGPKRHPAREPSVLRRGGEGRGRVRLQGQMSRPPRIHSGGLAFRIMAIRWQRLRKHSLLGLGPADERVSALMFL